MSGVVLLNLLCVSFFFFKQMTAYDCRISDWSSDVCSSDLTAVDALKDVNMQVASGEVVGLIGPSGSGKSTLLKSLGAVIEPSAGRMVLGEQVIYDGGWKVRDLRALRRDKIGFVFQAPYLIPFLDVTDNVSLLPMLAGAANAPARARAIEPHPAPAVQHPAQPIPYQLSRAAQKPVPTP